jgi:cystathionine beta-lyase/cystathionine gamma-synthase
VRDRGIGTRAVHGRRGSPLGPLETPIVQSSTFAFASSEEMRRYLEGDPGLYLYTRYENPTLRQLEESLAALEGGEAALVFSSGMAASTTGILALLSPGDEVVASASLYGGTTRFVRNLLPSLGFSSRIVPPADLVRPEAYGPKCRVLIFETPTNPCLDVVDIGAVVACTRALGLTVIIDNTFASPILQRPLELGVDLVMHSLTKTLGGHSDIVGGALVGSRQTIQRVREWAKVLGGCMDPHAAFLVLRGLKTLHLRVARQCANALALARHLEERAEVSRVFYPGLPTHPGHEIARRQMSGFGGIVSFVLKGGLPAAERFYDALHMIARAASLGGVESLVSLPVHTSHHGYTDEQLKTAGVDKGSIRLSLGVEDPEDVIADVDRALARV